MNASLQSRLNFEHNHVVWIIETTAVTLVCDRGPRRSYERNEYIARLDRTSDCIRKVSTKLDCIDVHENLGSTQTVSESVR